MPYPVREVFLEEEEGLELLRWPERTEAAWCGLETGEQFPFMGSVLGIYCCITNYPKF